jgi:hypothetical protein
MSGNVICKNELTVVGEGISDRRDGEKDARISLYHLL